MQFPRFTNMIIRGILIFPILLVLFPNNKIRLFIYALLIANALVIAYLFLKNRYFINKIDLPLFHSGVEIFYIHSLT